MNKMKIRMGLIGATIASLSLMTGCLPDTSYYSFISGVPNVPNEEEIQSYQEQLAMTGQLSGGSDPSAIENAMLQTMLENNADEFYNYISPSYLDEYVYFDAYSYYGYRQMVNPVIAYYSNDESNDAIAEIDAINNEIRTLYESFADMYAGAVCDSVDTAWIETIPYVYESNNYITIIITGQSIVGGSMDFASTSCNSSEVFYFDKVNDVGMTVEDVEANFAIDSQTQFEEAKKCYEEKLTNESKDATNIIEVNHFYSIKDGDLPEAYYYFECNGEYEYVACIPDATGSYTYECCGNQIKSPEDYNGGIVYICGNDAYKEAIAGGVVY